MSMQFPQKLWNNTLYAYNTLYFSDTICKYCTQKKKKKVEHLWLQLFRNTVCGLNNCIKSIVCITVDDYKWPFFLLCVCEQNWLFT